MSIIRSEKAREQGLAPRDLLVNKFGSLITGEISAQYVYSKGKKLVAGVSGLSFESPIISVILQENRLMKLFDKALGQDKNLLIKVDFENEQKILVYSESDGEVIKLDTCDTCENILINLIEDSLTWGGVLDSEGEVLFDPSTPSPGPHYYTNMLLGNRIKFPRPLQSTPKSAVDALGGGSFRSHADTQVLATKWDYLPEENGFPANRQFYLTENGKKIFWSGEAKGENITKVTTTHSQNRTIISYELKDGLEVTRTIFILPQIEGLPLASEAQLIKITNKSDNDRDLRIVYTGMFGTREVHALREDVIFSTVVSQSELFFDENDKIKAISFNPNPKWTKGNVRFNTLLVHDEDGQVLLPTEYATRYSEFVGNGTLSNPQFLSALSNKPSRKGPGFFALGTSFSIKAGGEILVNNFTSLSSDAVNESYVPDETIKDEIEAQIDKFSDRNALPEVLDNVVAFTKKYASYMSISHEDKNFESYVNNNLPFQVFYQTFVSRSLDWTQKGYREIGFREIQDIFASMYYFQGMGETEFIKKLLSEWTSNVYMDGYANHNFYWKGKEPGWWSDDALWLLQALDRYVKLTGDYDFLKSEISIATEIDESDERLVVEDSGAKRTILDTIKAIITYSAKISVGKHNIPLIDKADWNDCLRVDKDCINGKDKIQKYKEQLNLAGKAYGEIPFDSEYSESVMNGFLLKVAIDNAIGMFEKFGDTSYVKELTDLSSDLKDTLRENSWKDDFYARVLFNRKNNPELQYLGAKGDTLAVEENHPGTYFLNSFSWSILADVASEDQIETMLDSLDSYLRTPYGFRLCSTVDYSRVAPKIDVALYYPGDRENGGVFKHANMMAAAAMLKAAKTVDSIKLAARLADTAYWVIDAILPFRTLKHPFSSCGNPRWCTQYNNSDSGENIGPTLSGTSTWLLLCLFSCFGVEFESDKLIVEPLLRAGDTELNVTINSGKAIYDIKINKPDSFRRTKEGYEIFLDGIKMEGNYIPVLTDSNRHEVVVKFS